MKKKDVYISTSEASRLLQMTTRRVVGLCSEGKIAGAYRQGRIWKIPEESLNQYIENSGGLADRVAEKLPFAIGNTSYIEVSGECYYVDKTLLIRDLIDDHNMVTLFTRPRRFGKTLAINMLKTFFEKTDTDTSIYFKNRKGKGMFDLSTLFTFLAFRLGKFFKKNSYVVVKF